MERYGTDKPDTRYDYFVQDIKEIASHSDFRPFKESEAVKSIPFGENLSRKELDRLSKFAEDYYNTKISWLRFGKSQVSGSVKKFFSPELLKALREKTGEGTLLICAGKWKVTLKTLGALRLEIIKRLKPPSKQFQFLWVTEFPLFEWDDKINGWVPCHHLFTMPKNPEMITVDPGKVISRQYDLVLNGVEVGSGSIRIHNRELQEKVMKIVGLDKERRDKDFGFFLNALEYGAPPHGGIALGIDRILMVMLSRKSIQDVIPFPKTLTGMGPLEGVPSEVDEASLREVGIKVRSKQ
jgi:aspartyl-tRNA synthetase